MSSKAVFFPGLNTIRFIAAFIVIINHIELFKKNFKQPHFADIDAVHDMGRLGVVLFFVLSGFLITYLLLLEKERFKSIDVGKFYIRRALRIWPLYYFLLILSLFVFPHVDWFWVDLWMKKEEITLPVILFCVFFLPNWVVVSHPPILFFSQAWSVGVEEQFYFVWPFLIKRFKNIFWVLISIITLCLLIKLVLFPVLKYKIHYWNETVFTWKLFFNDFLIDTMAIGGLFAYAFHKKSGVLKFFYHPFVRVASYSLMVFLFVDATRIPFVKSELFAVLFGVLILNVSTNKNAYSKWFNLPLFDYLGKISFGIYMYHSLCIMITIKILLSYNLYNPVAVYFFSIAATILLSSLSYHYFEKYFLSWKDKFAKVHSTNTADKSSQTNH